MGGSRKNVPGGVRDIKRICEHPTDEDRIWFPDIAGSDWRKTLDFAMRNFKDESFIAQYLSRNRMRTLLEVRESRLEVL